jgi:hypothetical protein
MFEGMDRRQLMAKLKQRKPIPKFENEAEERAFWLANDTADYVNWGRARVGVFPTLKPTRNPKQP